MFDCLLITCSSVYLFFSYWLWRVWKLTYTIFSETAWFFSVRTNLVYWYYFPASFDVLTYTMLSLVNCLILPSYHAITYIRYDVPDFYNYHDNGNDDLTSWLHLDYNLIYSSTNYTPNTHILLTCSYSFPKSVNYLLNHKWDNLHQVGGNLWISICVRIYSGIRFVVQPKLPVRPKGLQVFRGERWPPTSYYIHENGIQ